MEEFGAKGFVEEGNGVILLSEDSPYAYARSICFNDKWLRKIW